MKLYQKVFILFAISLGTGFSVVHFMGNAAGERTPAAIRQYYDFTNLRGSALEIALKERIVSNLEIVRHEKDIGLRLGHFAFTNSQDQKKLGCQEYSQVALEFESADAAVNGEKSKMEIVGQCQASTDATMIEPLIIPMSRLIQDKPTDGDIKFMENSPVAVHLQNMPDDWPKQWHLIGLRLSKSSTNKDEKQFLDLNIDRNEVQKILGKPLVISF